MPKHSAPRLVRPLVVAGVSAVTLGLLAFPAQAHTTTAPPAAAAAPAAVPADQETVERRAAIAALLEANGGSWRALYERNRDLHGGGADSRSEGQLRFARGLED
uniref:hypothetical protein n=1 Tax=Modestobacter sp. KNN46-3 TaxID=2711218 RepID=UPI0019CF80E1